MMQIVASIWKINLGEAAEIIQEGEQGGEKKGKRCNTQHSGSIGHFLSPKSWTLKSRAPRGAADKRSWAARLRNQVVEARTCGWVALNSTTDGVKCWRMKNRWTSKLIKPGLWVKRTTPGMKENASLNQDIGVGKGKKKIIITMTTTDGVFSCLKANDVVD